MSSIVHKGLAYLFTASRNGDSLDLAVSALDTVTLTSSGVSDTAEDLDGFSADAEKVSVRLTAQVMARKTGHLPYELHGLLPSKTRGLLSVLNSSTGEWPTYDTTIRLCQSSSTAKKPITVCFGHVVHLIDNLLDPSLL